MILLGNNLVSPADSLRETSVQELHRMVSLPSVELQQSLARLRSVRNIDAKLYASLKKSLPYFVCGSFNPPFRRVENFACTDCFVVDIDHCAEKGMELRLLRHKVQSDDRVLLAFISPGGDGLKLLFRLKEKCYDAGLFPLFYKSFVCSFSELYGLEQVVDTRTCDVCRACFLSTDAEAYINESAESVDLNAYLPMQDAQALFDFQKKVQKEEARVPEKQPSRTKEPDDTALQHIKQTLHERIRRSASITEGYVPQQLESLMPALKQLIEHTGIVIEETTNIQYGKKLKVKLGILRGEINVFYGRRGYSVVQSPKRGTSSELNQTVADLLEAYLEGRISL